MTLPFYTIGHSTRTLAEFLGLLQVAEVTFIVDIRTIPKSRTNPQYNKETLPEYLASFKVGYKQIAELGGLRAKSKETSPNINGFWENQSFHNYADYALTAPFHAGLEQLIAIGQQRRCAMMCSETLWWRCHRRIVTDHLIARGENVFHLMGKNRVEPASMTKGARVQENSVVVYPSEKYKGKDAEADES